MKLSSLLYSSSCKSKEKDLVQRVRYGHKVEVMKREGDRDRDVRNNRDVKWRIDKRSSSRRKQK